MNISTALRQAGQAWNDHLQRPEVQSALNLLRITDHEFSAFRAIWKIDWLYEQAKEETES